MIEIDGSQGEGGGQILRTSLTLSILTGQPTKISQIRASRSKPGLLAQHLQCVEAAASVSKARVEGAFLGSTSLVFEPSGIRSGRYKFDIGTAGSTSLVLQTIFLPLSRAGSASTVIITGGTHVPHAPCFDYLDLQWLPVLRRIGFDTRLSMEQAGFYPQGGGRIMATIRPVGRIEPLRLIDRGLLQWIRGLSAVANLDQSIADRQKRQALKRLDSRRMEAKIKTSQLPSPGKGTLLLLLASFGSEKPEDVPAVDDKNDLPYPQCCYYALGELGKRAERVADEAVEALDSFLESSGTVDQFLADQILLPLAFASGTSEFITSQVTMHLLTNAAVIQTFLPAKIEIQGELGQSGFVRVHPTKEKQPGGRQLA